MGRCRSAALVLAAVVLAAASPACGGDDDGAGGSPSTTGAPTTEAPTAEAPTTGVPPASTDGGEAGPSAIEGTWVADAADLLAANTANVGGTGGLTCSGDITMTFAGGRLDRSGEVSCGVGDAPVRATGTVSTTGEYTVDGGTLTVTGTESSGRASLGGQDIPTPDNWGDGVATFRIDGDMLTLEFTDTAVGAVTQTYARAG